MFGGAIRQVFRSRFSPRAGSLSLEGPHLCYFTSFSDCGRQKLCKGIVFSRYLPIRNASCGYLVPLLIFVQASGI